MSLMALGFLGADDWDFATWAAEETTSGVRHTIARALMTNPELLLLDEITSALDPMLVGEVLDMVSELKEQGTTILMATHEMSFAHDAADRIVLLRRGVIAENGTPREVMDESRNPETREFFSHFRS